MRLLGTIFMLLTPLLMLLNLKRIADLRTSRGTVRRSSSDAGSSRAREARPQFRKAVGSEEAVVEVRDLLLALKDGGGT